MREFLSQIKDWALDKVPHPQRRSSKWPALRDTFISKYPSCSLCGSTKKLIVHHKLPIHLYPEYELDERNLITFCESKKYGANCHLFLGHLGNYRFYNTQVDDDAIIFGYSLAAKSSERDEYAERRLLGPCFLSKITKDNNVKT